MLDELERHHVPAGPVLAPTDALDHPYFKSRDMVRWVDDPRTGRSPSPGSRSSSPTSPSCRRW
ncbi:MAG: CoA transferase [Acidimicrobiales bacterium]